VLTRSRAPEAVGLGGGAELAVIVDPWGTDGLALILSVRDPQSGAVVAMLHPVPVHTSDPAELARRLGDWLAGLAAGGPAFAKSDVQERMRGQFKRSVANIPSAIKSLAERVREAYGHDASTAG